MKLIPEYKSDFHQFLNYVTCFQFIVFLFLIGIITFGIELFGFNENELFIMFMINLSLAYIIIKYLEKYGKENK